MIKTYKQIIKSRKIIDKTIANLDMNLTYEDICRMLTVSTTEDTELITITIRSNYYKEATKIANEIANVFIEQMNEDMSIDNIVVIDSAIDNATPVSPNMTKLSALGVIGGLFVGFILSLIFESMDNKIKNHDDVKKYLKMKTIGMIPNYNTVGTKKKNTPIKRRNNIILLDEPNSVISESIRMLRTNLSFMDLKVINVVSTVPSEGKSEIITNLAVSFALLEKKVLLVDCDLRKPKIHRNFGLSRLGGVTDVVLSNGTKAFHDVIQTYTDKESGKSIDILSSGSKVSNPSELINSKSFAKLVDELRNNYDLVLIDCPPVSSMTDGMLVSYLSDGTFYVIESDRTDYQVIKECLEELKNNKAFLLGTVLTKVNLKSQKKLYGYKYDYYYSNYDK